MRASHVVLVLVDGRTQVIEFSFVPVWSVINNAPVPPPSSPLPPPMPVTIGRSPIGRSLCPGHERKSLPRSGVLIITPPKDLLQHFGSTMNSLVILLVATGLCQPHKPCLQQLILKTRVHLSPKWPGRCRLKPQDCP